MSKRKNTGATPPFDPRSMEKMMRDITKLLEEKQFGTIEEANAFLDQFVGKPLPEVPVDDDPLSRAQDLIYQAYEAPSRTQAIKLAKQALEVSPDCADAYVLLAETETGSLKKIRDYYQKGVEAGERALGPEVFEKDAGHFWGIMETRPYMRARKGLAMTLWLLGDEEAALKHFRDMLRLNPNDNQGIRYLLSDCLFEIDADEELTDLLDRYKDDASASWLYDRALLNFRQHGDSPDANSALQDAMKHNPHVPDYLLGKKKMPQEMPEYVGFGDKNEAIDYASTGIANWRNTYGAIRWLRNHTTGHRK